MRTLIVLLVLGILFAGMAMSGGQAFAQTATQYGTPSRDYGPQDSPYGQYGQYGYGQYGPMAWTLGDRELRNLVAPIALYPDPLLAIILPASTYVDDVIDADRRNWRGNEADLNRQRWDISVRALVHYPQLLHMMARDPDWTAALGQAYVYQPQDLMDAIQYLRRRAWDNGVLRTTRQQRVKREGDYYRIVPAEPNYIYIPQYDPDVVYRERRSNRNENLLSFGIGLIIGAWLNNDTDWHRHRIYEHGWQGGGWVGSYRPRITVNDIYTRDRNRSVVGNHDIIRRPVDYGKLRTYKLPGVTAKQPLNYPKGQWKERNRGGDNSSNQTDQKDNKDRQRQRDSND